MIPTFQILVCVFMLKRSLISLLPNFKEVLRRKTHHRLHTHTHSNNPPIYIHPWHPRGRAGVVCVRGCFIMLCDLTLFRKNAMWWVAGIGLVILGKNVRMNWKCPRKDLLHRGESENDEVKKGFSEFYCSREHLTMRLFVGGAQVGSQFGVSRSTGCVRGSRRFQSLIRTYRDG